MKRTCTFFLLLLAPSLLSAAGKALFVANDGRVDREIRFYSSNGATLTYVTPDRVVTSLGGNSQASGDTVALSLEDNMKATVEGEGSPSADLHSGARGEAFPQVRMSQAYPGIDMLFSGAGSQLRYEIDVLRQADTSRLRWKVGGASALRVDRDGSLVIQTPDGEIRWARPIATQEYLDKGTKRVPCQYMVDGDEVRFAIGQYDHDALLTIKPGAPASNPVH